MCAAQANVTARLRTVAGIQEHINPSAQKGQKKTSSYFFYGFF
jgi:hypothetical protein